jgi:membrane-associated protease RseP (regulator of RpoE activity)
MQDNDIASKAQALARLIEQRLGVRGRTLEKAVRRAGRLLPREVRAKAMKLVEAQQMAENPKLARLIDREALDTAYHQVAAYLEAKDPAEQRKTRLLNMLAGIVFNLLLVVALFVFVLWWRDLL